MEPPREGPDRAPSALTWPFRRLWWTIEDRLIWPIRRGSGNLGGGLSRATEAAIWPFRKLWWAIEDRLIWPVSDFFAGIKKDRTSAREGRSKRSAVDRRPLAWVGATALAMVAIGATAAAVFFYNEAEDSNSGRIVVQGSDPQTVIVPMEPNVSNDPTLEGVAPRFEAAAGSDGKNSGALPANAVEPAPEPKEPAMEAAHRFATAFAAWEVGRKAAIRTIKETTTRRLGRELAARPPRLPEGVKVPRARVLNVVE
ncbi:MAG: hypothetical protein ACO3CR_05980, partial [Solirubrobacterales bacterium]